MSTLRFSRHALQRMLEWQLEVVDVQAALASRETVEEYDDGSLLILGRSKTRPLHVVLREDDALIFVITVYEPDPNRWDPSFTRRISS